MLALSASVALLTQQSLQTWLIAGGYVVVGTILFLVARAARRREHRQGTAEPTRELRLERPIVRDDD
ncbi:hypothetical protein L332_05295 [Agrococcus pavilionensis RW1]|uniref:Uncharacterized protein n=1 Tax=Agrococcus pavilionensis RW1 TaxID=1330458 RepID=U1LPG4_9MICO|nr:hypothetical protein [Agrococcus pavilionensis]ERG63887.1 hypothetical protein L332_05295 [Agrococcus pavilionensis RW1]